MFEPKATPQPPDLAMWHRVQATASRPRKMPVEIWSSRLRSGSAHCDLELAARTKKEQVTLDTAPMPATSLAIAHLPLNQGVGLASATILVPSAYWASWADAIPVLQQQAPEAFAQILQQLQADHIRSHALEAAQRAATAIQKYGWQPPDWQHIADGVAPPRSHHNFEDGVALGRGWQHKAATATHTAFRAEVRDRVDPGSQVLLESQTGPRASRAFTTIPYHNDNSYPSHLFRLLLSRRLRLPLPLSAHFCRRRRALDPLGDHRAACAQSGLLRARGGGPGTGSSPHMQGSGGTGNNKHPPGRPQPRTPRPPR